MNRNSICFTSESLFRGKNLLSEKIDNFFFLLLELVYIQK